MRASAVSKDRLFAGVTLATALVLTYSNQPMRNEVAMKGELRPISLVLPVGGIKEKVLAAHRNDRVVKKLIRIEISTS